ncbi:MAG: hypothetical protein AAFQ63_08675 [Cyanobacteria bacterium J06621_11]
MSDKLFKNDEYRTFIQDLKQRIQSAQIKAAISINSACSHCIGIWAD